MRPNLRTKRLHDYVNRESRNSAELCVCLRQKRKIAESETELRNVSLPQLYRQHRNLQLKFGDSQQRFEAYNKILEYQVRFTQKPWKPRRFRGRNFGKPVSVNIR